MTEDSILIQDRQYCCPQCGQEWAYSDLDLAFVKKDGCCHECVAGVEDYPANEGG